MLTLAYYTHLFSYMSLFLFLQLHQQCEDKNVLRYVYYYLARILSDNGSQGSSAAGGIPTPNWDALADIDVVGGVTRADVVPRIVNQLSAESTSDDVECRFYTITSVYITSYHAKICVLVQLLATDYRTPKYFVADAPCLHQNQSCLFFSQR
jgi:hypothetical protein